MVREAVTSSQVTWPWPHKHEGGARLPAPAVFPLNKVFTHRLDEDHPVYRLWRLEQVRVCWGMYMEGWVGPRGVIWCGAFIPFTLYG